MPVREAIRDVQHAHAVTFDAIGTRWSIRSDYPLDTETITRVRERIDEFDRCYSRFRDDSYVCMVAGHPGQWPLPADAAPMFALYDRLDEITGGAVNPLVGSRMEFLGYDSSYRLRPAGAVTTQRTPRWTEHVVWGDGVLRTTPGVGVIDVGAIGKGYLIDLVGGVLRSAGHQDWLIDAGGDILASGRPRRIGLEHPYRLGEVIGVVTIQDEAICASGTARRAWGGRTAPHRGCAQWHARARCIGNLGCRRYCSRGGWPCHGTVLHGAGHPGGAVESVLGDGSGKDASVCRHPACRNIYGGGERRIPCVKNVKPSGGTSPCTTWWPSV